MAIFLKKSHGTGRGTCRLCDKLIKKGEEQIIAFSGKNSGRYHTGCVVQLVNSKVKLVEKAPVAPKAKPVKKTKPVKKSK